ncbi:MAG: metal-dependent hydrolase [Bdellovibrionales bacterium]
MKLTWLGHSCMYLETNETSILIDPYISGNPTFPMAQLHRAKAAENILLTHGHGDHLGDAVALAREGKANLIAIFELAFYAVRQGVKQDNVIDMNIGGYTDVKGARIHMVQALHSNSIQKGNEFLYGGMPTGFVIEADGTTIYYAGDTGLFSDMKLIQDFYKPTVAMLPIGNRYTMSPEAAAYACNTLLDVKTVIPMHYGTIPQLTETADSFKSLVTRGEVLALAPGEEVTI